MQHSIQLLRKSFLSGLLLLVTAFVMAQDSTATSTSTTTTTTTEKIWYMQPWAWIVGGIILLLIIMLAARGGGNSTSRSNKVTVTKTVRTDTDDV